MPDTLIAAVVEGLRQTVPFHRLPATSRPTEALWSAVNDTLLQLRLPLHHARLGKPRPKQKVYDAAIQSGLAVLGAFARQVGTSQAIVRIAGGAPEAISFQPRPFGANWTREHGITPVALQSSWSDPLLERDPGEGPRLLTRDVATRDIIHLRPRSHWPSSTARRPIAGRRAPRPSRSPGPGPTSRPASSTARSGPTSHLAQSSWRAPEPETRAPARAAHLHHTVMG